MKDNTLEYLLKISTHLQNYWIKCDDPPPSLSDDLIRMDDLMVPYLLTINDQQIKFFDTSVRNLSERKIHNSKRRVKFTVDTQHHIGNNKYQSADICFDIITNETYRMLNNVTIVELLIDEEHNEIGIVYLNRHWRPVYRVFSYESLDFERKNIMIW